MYVLGEVTQVFEPNSEQDLTVAAAVPEIDPAWSNLFCRVEFKKMGFKESLKKETKNYINKIVQPTLAQICRVGAVWSNSTNAELVRADLWNNANIDISPDDFKD